MTRRRPMPEHGRALLIILDGLGDRPCAALGRATPLESAVTPVLDALAERGQCGLVDPLYPGVPVGTHTGTGVLLGMPPRESARLARGPVEAAGVGLPMQAGDIALRCNFATVEPDKGDLRVVDRRAGRISEGTDELAAALTDIDLGDGIRGSLRAGTQHRGVLHLSGPRLSPAISDTDPGSDGERVLSSHAVQPENPAAIRTARALDRFLGEAHERFREHPVNLARQARGLAPANAIITRGAGSYVPERSLIQRLDVRPVLVAAECTILGLARLLGYETITDPRFTALADTDVDAKVSAARAALVDHELVVLHVKATDVFAHDCDPVGKRDFIERIDAALQPFLDEDLVVGVTADHSTDSGRGRHTGDPVPSLLVSPGGHVDSCRALNERVAANGGLGRIPASGFLASLLDAAGLLPKYRPQDAADFSLD